MDDKYKCEIVERSSGFWIVDGSGVVIDDPFDTYEEALDFMNSDHFAQVRYYTNTPEEEW